MRGVNVFDEDIGAWDFFFNEKIRKPTKLLLKEDKEESEYKEEEWLKIEGAITKSRNDYKEIGWL